MNYFALFALLVLCLPGIGMGTSILSDRAIEAFSNYPYVATALGIGLLSLLFTVAVKKGLGRSAKIAKARKDYGRIH